MMNYPLFLFYKLIKDLIKYIDILVDFAFK